MQCTREIIHGLNFLVAGTHAHAQCSIDYFANNIFTNEENGYLLAWKITYKYFYSMSPTANIAKVSSRVKNSRIMVTCYVHRMKNSRPTVTCHVHCYAFYIHSTLG